MEKKFYNCSNNIVFKEVMLKKGNEDILCEFLENIVKEKINSYKIYSANKEKKTGIYLDSMVIIEVKTDKQTLDIGIIIGDVEEIFLISAMFMCSGSLYYIEYNDRKKILLKFSYNARKYKDFRKDKDLMEYHFVNRDNNTEKFKNIVSYEYNMDKLLEYWKNNNKKKIKKFEMILMLLLSKEDLEILSKNNKTIEKYKNKLVKLNDSGKLDKYKFRKKRFHKK